MPPKANTDSKIKTTDLFRPNGLTRTPPGTISRAFPSIPHFPERTPSTASDSNEEIEREDTPMKNLLTARKKQPVSTHQVQESGSPILPEEEQDQNPVTHTSTYVHQTDDTPTRLKDASYNVNINKPPRTRRVQCIPTS